MPEQWQLNGFYDISKLNPLLEAMEQRYSCRLFDCAPSAQQWERLQKAAETLALPGVRIVLNLCDTSLFQPMGGILMKFENVQRYAAIITTNEDPRSLVNAGVSGEMLLLSAVADGMAGVWVSGTYKKNQTGLTLGEGEKLRALIALGIPKTSPTLPIARKRKEIAQICAFDTSKSPAVVREMARAIQIAPSAMNIQPWLLSMPDEKEMTVSVKRPAQQLDLGIAMCHALLAMGRTSADFALSPDGQCASVLF